MTPSVSANDFVWCAAGPPGTETGRKDANEGSVRGGKLLARLLSANPASDDGVRTGKLGQGCLAVETVNAGDGYTSLSITCADDMGLAHLFGAVLSEIGMDVVAAKLTTAADLSHPGQFMAVNKFKITRDGKAVQQSLHGQLQDQVIAALQSKKPRVSSSADETLPLGVRSFCSNNIVDAKMTLIELTCDTRHGLLRDLGMILKLNSVYISSCSLRTELEQSYYSILTTDRKSRKLTPRAIKKLATALQAEDISQPSSCEHQRPPLAKMAKVAVALFMAIFVVKYGTRPT
ncbi:hypothetical protein CYMTET_33972 [Cymbomonas tetramitiformis]|uniref:Uncharacterized protein n=1 Tax=Cymbomonas tetramitiformis TaxID=36881 RepID=A0AAE0FCJ3_9CHLO|nr:hypothetical protein CYMTET_33972 [Cymbomonas tetramitiformis]